MDEIKKIFSAEGLLKKKLPDYDFRPQQERMASVVKQAIDEKSVAIVEGATGVGKSFAYLVPIILSDGVAVISTSNKSLQDQLSNKDLPALKKLLKTSFEWTVLKGKHNYFCPQHFEANKKELRKILGENGVRELRDWSQSSKDGDLEYYEGELPIKAKELVGCNVNIKHEKGSLFKELCFGEKARERVNSSKIILVNHTLLTIDMALKAETEGKAKLLPHDIDTFVVDEAHTLERYASMAFSDAINVWSVKHFLDQYVVRKSIKQEEYVRIISLFEDRVAPYLPDKRDEYYEQKKVTKFKGFVDVTLALERVLGKVRTNKKLGSSEEVELKINLAMKEGQKLIGRLEGLMTSDNNTLKWAEARKSGFGKPTVTMKSVPISVAELMKELLVKKGRAVIFTSATLSLNGSFDFFKEQMGIDKKAYEMILGSPFDFKNNSLAYISTGQIDQIEEVEKLLKYSKGRAFVLFTSYREMQRFYDEVKTKYPKLIQSPGISRVQLVEEFKEIGNAVLFATKSFWEGVDIKGENLSMVIIQKIPFNNPSDLLYQSKIEQIDKKYKKAGSHWMKYTIPEACLVLKQGFGRLIRSRTDKGVYALLDSRVNFKNYKNQVIRTLPETTPRTQKLDNVKLFFEGNLRID